ncbi:MAG: glycosyltransferase MshA [Actinomycetota bacterium]|jgi:D-inositol-3-phosphate glycosyltransferase
MLSFHTSPLAQPGVGDSGGMNVYVRELVAGLAHAGVEVTTYTREWRSGLPREVLVEPNHRVVHVPAGRFDLPKEELEGMVPTFTDFVLDDIRHAHAADVVHANYWLSGVAGHSIKHELDIPLVTTFHTLARVKAEGGDPEPERRERAEAQIIGCADAICVSCDEEEDQFRRLYGNPPGLVEIVAPGVEHAFFTPGDKRGARFALGMGEGPVLLFVGRIQPLKGVDVAVRALAALNRRDASLYVVGGASGLEGDTEVIRVNALISELGLTQQVHFVEPQAHHMLSTYYRAADAVWVPSRSESFGLVALEAAACGTPVIANAVGGLLSLVDHGLTGYLVADRDPNMFAQYTAELLNNPALASAMSIAAAERGRRYTWSFAAARLRRVYTDITSRALVNCS